MSRDIFDRDVRCKLAEALGAIGNEEVAQQLLKLLNDEKLDHFVRSKIVLALGTFYEAGKLEYNQLIEILFVLFKKVDVK